MKAQFITSKLKTHALHFNNNALLSAEKHFAGWEVCLRTRSQISFKWELIIEREGRERGSGNKTVARNQIKLQNVVKTTHRS